MDKSWFRERVRLCLAGHSPLRNYDSGVEKMLPADARCLRCGYHLFGLPEAVCPECGRHFRPDDPSTFVLSGQWRWPHIPAPPPEWHIAVLLPICLAYAYLSSVPGGLLASSSWSICALVPLALAVFSIFAFEYVSRGCAIWLERRWAPKNAAPSYRPLRRWLTTPVCAMLIVSVMLTSWPLRIRFHFAKGDFENAVNLLGAGAAPADLIGDYGSLRIIDVDSRPHGVFFVTGNLGFEEIGVYFSPADRRVSKGQKTRLAAHWYTAIW